MDCVGKLGTPRSGMKGQRNATGIALRSLSTCLNQTQKTNTQFPNKRSFLVANEYYGQSGKHTGPRAEGVNFIAKRCENPSLLLRGRYLTKTFSQPK